MANLIFTGELKTYKGGVKANLQRNKYTGCHHISVNILFGIIQQN